jgi:hypothetical protein
MVEHFPIFLCAMEPLAPARATGLFILDRFYLADIPGIVFPCSAHEILMSD